MPLIQITTSARPGESEIIPNLLKRLSRELAEQLKKPERYVMTAFTPPLHMTFAGSEEPTALVQIKNIGKLTPEQTESMSRKLCDVLRDELELSPDRVYIEFVDVERHLWGYDGSTFA